MAMRNILQEGDTTLRKISKSVEKIDARILQLLDDMAETMYAADGAGLAAPQVGILRRIVVIDDGNGLIELINPQIVSSRGKQSVPEGCLSCPGVRGIVDRPSEVRVRALDREGNMVEYEGEDLLARAFCHEIDHLDGILFIDKVTKYVEDDE